MHMYIHNKVLYIFRMYCTISNVHVQCTIITHTHTHTHNNMTRTDVMSIHHWTALWYHPTLAVYQTIALHRHNYNLYILYLYIPTPMAAAAAVEDYLIVSSPDKGTAQRTTSALSHWDQVHMIVHVHVRTLCNWYVWQSPVRVQTESVDVYMEA